MKILNVSPRSHRGTHPFGPLLSPASILLSLALSRCARAHAADLYVSATGSDTASGRTASAAFRTLRKAAETVQPGDTVLVGDGTYTDADTAAK